MIHDLRFRAGFRVFAGCVLQHLLIERQVRHEPLQLAVLFLELRSRRISDGIRPPYFFLQL